LTRPPGEWRTLYNDGAPGLYNPLHIAVARAGGVARKIAVVQDFRLGNVRGTRYAHRTRDHLDP
jgi:hypothetical protein